MAAKKRRKPGLLWRVLFGHNGPTKARFRNELEKALRVKLTDTFVVPTRDSTGRVRKQTWRIDPDGTTRQVQQRPKKKAAAKKASGKRTVSQPSKPSRASKTGSAQRRQAAAVPPAVRTGHAAPITERYLQGADGRLAGSRPADPERRQRRAEAELRAAIRAAQASAKSADQRAERLLGWERKR